MVETTTVVVSGTGGGVLVVTGVEDGMGKVETGEDGKGELVERDAEDTDTGDENVSAVEVVGDEGVDVEVEAEVNSDVDELVECVCDKEVDEIVKDEVNIVRDVVNGNVSEAETSELELEEEGCRLVPALVLVSVFGADKSEVKEALGPN